jgi:hypothetical protein
MHFVEIDLHRNPLLLTIPDAPATETKSPLRGLRQRAGFPIKLLGYHPCSSANTLIA